MGLASVSGDLTFSIVIPTYNRLASLKRALASIYAQPFPKERYEVIVADDGSSDGTWEWIEEQRAEGLLPLRQEHLGQGHARNNALKHARGRYVAFIDDDCVVDGHWLELLAAAFQSTGSDAVGGSVINAESDNVWAWTSQEIVNFFAARAPALLPANNIAYRKSVLDELGGFDPRFRAGVAAEERELNQRLLWRGAKMFVEPAARVYHYNRVSLFSFLRQQYGYGGGAYIFYRLAGEGSGKKVRHFPLRVYRRLFIHFLRVRNGRRVPRVIALALSQMAVAFGYLTAGARALVRPLR